MKERNLFPSQVATSHVDVPKYIEFDSEELPEVLGWMIGGKYRLDLLVEEVSESKDEDQEAIRVRFKILDMSTKRGDLPDHIKKLVDNTHQ